MVAGILSCMLPCLRLYAYLGCQLAAAYPDLDHEYADWVRTYSSPDYLKIPASAEAVLDESGAAEPYGELLGGRMGRGWEGAARGSGGLGAWERQGWGREGRAGIPGSGWDPQGEGKVGTTGGPFIHKVFLAWVRSLLLAAL